MKMQMNQLPASEISSKQTSEKKLWDEMLENRHASFITNESLNADLTVTVSPFVSDKLSTNNQSIEITTLEKVRLRRVANSFSVQVPATEFIVNPVKSLFSSFLGQETDASVKNLQVGNYDSFASSDCHRLSTCDLNMVIQHDEDEIKQTRLMT